MAYASGTTVAVNRTREEIEKTLKRYGATAFGFAYDERGSIIYFRLDGLNIQTRVPAPPEKSYLFTPTGKRRVGKAAIETARDAEERRRWRVLLLLVKAKLEAIRTGDTTVAREFFPDVLLPDGATVEQITLPRIREVYQTGRVAGLLPEWNG